MARRALRCGNSPVRRRREKGPAGRGRLSPSPRPAPWPCEAIHSLRERPPHAARAPMIFYAVLTGGPTARGDSLIPTSGSIAADEAGFRRRIWCGGASCLDDRLPEKRPPLQCPRVNASPSPRTPWPIWPTRARSALSRRCRARSLPPPCRPIRSWCGGSRRCSGGRGSWARGPARRGGPGSCILLRAITLDQVLRAVDGCAQLGCPPPGARGCPVGERIPRAVMKAIQAADDAVVERLRTITVADLLIDPGAGQRRLSHGCKAPSGILDATASSKPRCRRHK